MRWLAFVLVCLAAAPAALADDPIAPIRKAAERANEQGDHRRAAELYVSVLPRIRQAPPQAQRAVLAGLLGTCRAMVGRKQVEPAVRALVAMLGATRPSPGDPPVDPGLAAEIRSSLERLAFDLVVASKPALAEQALRALMTDGPGTAMRWALLARTHIEQGEFERASQTLRRGLALYSGAPQLLFVRAALAGALSERAVSRANYLGAERMLLRAARDLEQAAEAEPDTPGIQRALGKIRGSLWVYYRATGQFARSTSSLQKAEDSYDSAACLDPKNPDVSLELANLLYAAHDWDWAVRTYRTAARRYQALQAQPGLSPLLRRAITQQLEHCREQIGQSLQYRAQAAAAGGHFERARELVRLAAADRPAYRSRVPGLIRMLNQAERIHQRSLLRLQGQPDDPVAQRDLGDLWVRSRQFDRAAQAYRHGLAHATQAASRSELQSRLADVEQVPDTRVELRMLIGQIEVDAEIPPGLDAGRLRNTLEKAHALTMAVFDHRLIGPLSLKVFSNQRQFLERAGVDLGPHQRGLYAFGRVVTFNAPNRPQAEWLDILVHEMTHRYVDEMTYNRSPRWLSEGLAQWASQGFGPEHQRGFGQLVRAGGLVAWSELDQDATDRWADPLGLTALYLQSHQVVDWLMRRFGLEKVMALLAGLRQGQDLDEAAWAAFGARLDQLERRWRREHE